MLNGGLFSEINGCISTGKEANVYHAVTEDGTDLAVKVYKTSILVFKDRDRHAIFSLAILNFARPPASSAAPLQPSMHGRVTLF